MLTPSHQLFFTQWLQEALSSELSGWGTEADHSLPSCTQLVNVCGCSHSMPYSFDGVVHN
jgi:hypothetical protein